MPNTQVNYVDLSTGSPIPGYSTVIAAPYTAAPSFEPEPGGPTLQFEFSDIGGTISDNRDVPADGESVTLYYYPVGSGLGAIVCGFDVSGNQLVNATNFFTQGTINVSSPGVVGTTTATKVKAPDSDGEGGNFVSWYSVATARDLSESPAEVMPLAAGATGCYLALYSDPSRQGPTEVGVPWGIMQWMDRGLSLMQAIIAFTKNGPPIGPHGPGGDPEPYSNATRNMVRGVRMIQSSLIQYSHAASRDRAREGVEMLTEGLDEFQRYSVWQEIVV